MFNIKIPQNRLRKLRTFGLGKKVFEFTNDKETNLIDLCSNDYFGLSRDKDIIKAAYETSLSQGLGSGSSRFISGTREVHQLLENELAEWLNQDKVLLFPSGYQANIAAVQALANRKSIVIADKLIHNSLLTGVRASGAKLIRFLHNNPRDLKLKLSNFSSKTKSILVIVESLYSMEGTLAPLKEIISICQEYKAELLVDEAHALGIVGTDGKGLCNQFPKSVTMISGTLGKSFGSGGAFLACKEVLGEKLIQNSDPFRYTTALSPSLTAGALKALEKIKYSNWGLELLDLSKKWRDEIIKIGKFKVQGDCHILSIIIGDENETLRFQEYLEKKGFLAIAIRPPTVQIGKSRIRITIRKTFNQEILNKFIEALKSYK